MESRQKIWPNFLLFIKKICPSETDSAQLGGYSPLAPASFVYDNDSKTYNMVERKIGVDNKGGVTWNVFIASKWSTMLQSHALISLFLICNRFPAKNRGFIATGSRKTSALKQQQLIPMWRRVGHCNLKLLANNTVFSCFHSGRP